MKNIHLDYKNNNLKNKKSFLRELDFTFSPETQDVEGHIEYIIILSGEDEWINLPITKDFNLTLEVFIHDYYGIYGGDIFGQYNIPDMSSVNRYEKKHYSKTRISDINIPEVEIDPIFELIQDKTRQFLDNIFDKYPNLMKYKIQYQKEIGEIDE